MEQQCLWLTTTTINNYILLILGPLSAILLAILISLAIILYLIYFRQNNKLIKNRLNDEKTTQIRYIFKYLILNVFLLTLASMFAIIWLIEMRENLKLLAAFMFSIINCLLTFSVLLGHVLFNKQVIILINRCVQCKEKKFLVVPAGGRRDFFRKYGILYSSYLHGSFILT